MKMGRRHLMWLMVGLSLLTACKPSVPKEVIQPDDMEDILYDFHVSQGMPMQEGQNLEFSRNLYFEAVLKKHDVTRAEFDSSLVYYYTRADYLMEIYKNVQERLGDEALVLGASAGEVERYSTLSLSGDTADVWEGPRHVMLMLQRPYHLLQFYQKADSSYHAGDRFLLTFDNTYLSQSGNKQTVVYMAVTYENDSTAAQNGTVYSMGTTSLRIPAAHERVKEIRGYILMGSRMEDNASNDLCLLFLDRIQLIRFHTQDPSEQPAPQMDSVKIQKPDSLKPRVHRLGERPVPASN